MTNPFAPEVKACPYPFYEELRAEHPVRWSPEVNAWLVTGHEQVVAVLRNHGAFSSKNSIFGGPELEHPEFPSMINADGSRHDWLRGLAAEIFTPRALNTLAPRIREVTSQLLDAVEDKEVFDVVADLASPLPVKIIAELIGVESHRFAEFKEWSDDTIRRLGRAGPESANGPGRAPNGFVPTLGRKARVAGRLVAAGDYAGLRARLANYLPGFGAPRRMSQLEAYFAEVVADRRVRPRDDLVTRLTRGSPGERLTDPEIVAFCTLLLVAGNESTSNLISTAVHALILHPEQMARLRERPELIDGLIEESLRWDAPIQGFYRRATADTDLAGQRIEEGDALLVLFAAANRDPARFVRPDDFDIERGRRAGHVSFGVGKHRCLGANLARLEARIGLEGVLSRFETLTPAEGHEDAWRDTPFFRGLAEYPLRFTPRRATAAR